MELADIESGENTINEIHNIECPICLSKTYNSHNMPCCNNIICLSCYFKWHIIRNKKRCVYCRLEDESYIVSNVDELNEYRIPEPEPRRRIVRRVPFSCKDYIFVLCGMFIMYILISILIYCLMKIMK